MPKVDPYKETLQDIPFGCWYCGRYMHQRPDYWRAGFYLERAHIVNHPRIEDRRCVVILCSCCHRAYHDKGLNGYELPIVTVGNMLWLKRTFDREYYDRTFMRKYSVSSLPACEVPPKRVMEAFLSRNVGYPRQCAESKIDLTSEC